MPTRVEAVITTPIATLGGPMSIVSTTSSRAMEIPAKAANQDTVARSHRWLDLVAGIDPEEADPEEEPERSLGDTGVTPAGSAIRGARASVRR